MFLVNQAMIDVPVGTAALIVVLGMAVVFFGLILLMYVTKITGKIMQSREKKADVHTEAPAAVPAPAKAAAPGSAGEIKLHDVPDKTAAMLMAIVADKLGFCSRAREQGGRDRWAEGSRAHGGLRALF